MTLRKEKQEWRQRCFGAQHLPLGFGLTGCMADPDTYEMQDGDEIDFDSMTQEELDALGELEPNWIAPKGMYDYQTGGTYTAYTSEERQPVYCPSGQAAVGAHCDGRYCDNYQLICKKMSGADPGTAYWTDWFDYDGNMSGACQDGYWVTGVQCMGSYCDNLRFRCTSMGKRHTSCRYSDRYHSEESWKTPFRVEGNRFITAGHCYGSHCDNKRYTSCETK